MPGLADRLREAREGLALSQAAMADLCGVTARSQRNYESGERFPDAVYLTALSSAGADVLYVLTGKRNQPVSEVTTLGAQQRALLNSFDMCTPAAQKQLLQLAALMAAGLPSGGSVTQTNRGDGAIQVAGSGNVVKPRK